MGKTNKVKQLGWPAEAQTIKLRNEGKSFRDIAEELRTRFDTELTRESVRRFYNKHYNENFARMDMQDRSELQKKKMEKIMDVGSKMEEIEEQLDTIKNETLDIEDKNDVGQILQVMKEIRQMMKFQKEYLEDVSTDTTIENMEVNNTAIQISEKLLEYEEEGIIEIKKPGSLAR
jgi:hypothetical protein